jgi:predicted transcriptional regulator
MAYPKEHVMVPYAAVRTTVDGATPMRAWREYVELTQDEVARRLAVSVPV